MFLYSSLIENFNLSEIFCLIRVTGTSKWFSYIFVSTTGNYDYSSSDGVGSSSHWTTFGGLLNDVSSSSAL